MKAYDKLFINGDWVSPNGKGSIDVINAATEEVMGRVPEGTPEEPLTVEKPRLKLAESIVDPANPLAFGMGPGSEALNGYLDATAIFGIIQKQL
jgi:hypothetical protein